MDQTTENNILLHITGKKKPADVTVNELLQLTLQYPAFGAAHLLLAKKAQNEDQPNKDKYAQVAALHFTNPHWFHFKMNEDELMKNVTLTTTPVGAKENSTEDVDEIIIQGFEGDLANEDAIGGNENNISEAVETQPTQPVETAEAIIEAPAENTDLNEPEQVINNEVEAGQDDAQGEEVIPPAAAEEPKQEPIAEIATPNEAEEQNDDAAVELDEHPGTEAIQEPISTETDGKAEADDTGEFEDADAENESLAPALNEKISSVLQDQLEEFKKPVAENTPVPIETEPYHTVDYFASQGIKLSKELQKQDHLAVKVKKFTDWLKQMKRINPTPADLGIDEATEHKVQDSAASSNEVKEVVTEAMAEVLAMQGMKEKAIQVYIKLSFLDPSKTAYFAAKIDQLKGM